jgi:nucleoside-triphosphate--adenylate kinase
MLRAILVGPPGSGKGTISNMMVKVFKVKHISSGDLLRSSTSKSLESAMKAGQLLPDDVVEQVVLPELKKCKHWLLDGYPRTIVQAKSLLKQQQVDMLINLNVPDETILERLQGRWIHVTSGRIYHTIYNPPKAYGLDDVTGEPLSQREDDHPDIVKKRLSIYHEQTNPLLDYFKQLKILKTYTGTESKTIWPHIKKDVEDYMKLSQTNDHVHS